MLLVTLALCLLLSFGRTAFGSLVALIPGSGDVFFRRFMMGVQLAALLLAGLGAAWVGRALWERLPAAARRPSVQGIAALAAAVIVLAPAWIELARYDHHNAAAIAVQRHADATQGAELGRLLARIRRDGRGRVYAGEPTNWGDSFTVGAVPVFKYLESQDIDEVGYTLRTASLMTDPEYFFDDTDPGDYILFGIRYLIVPAGYEPPVRATFTARAGPYSLWTLPDGGYVHTATITGTLTADRGNVGVRSIGLLHSPLAQHAQALRVLWSPGRPQPLTRATATGPPGAVLTTRAQLAAGLVDATVRMRRAGVIVLSVSYDPGWTATVDGRQASTVMVAPALVAMRVPAGTHLVAFCYRGYPDYPLLFAVCAATLLGLLGYERARLRSAHA
ncbi:MAG: YfhO family protein [Solirubrobacteraceae bacterium]